MQYKEGRIPEVDEIDEQLTSLRDQIKNRQQERQAAINAEARKIASWKIGDEVEQEWGRGRSRKKRKYRIVEITGSYSILPQSQTGMLFVDYLGQHVRNDGTLGNDKRNVYPAD